jgi:hypothetical protein
MPIISNVIQISPNGSRNAYMYGAPVRIGSVIKRGNTQ